VACSCGGDYSFSDGYSGGQGTTEALVEFTRKSKWIKIYNDDTVADTILYRFDQLHHQSILAAGDSIELSINASGIYLDSSASSTPYRIVVLG